MAGKPPRWLANPTPGRSPYAYPCGRQARARTALACASNPGTQGPIQACRLPFFLSVRNSGCKADAHRTSEHIKRQEHEAHAGRVSGRAGGGGAGHHHLGAPRVSPSATQAARPSLEVRNKARLLLYSKTGQVPYYKRVKEIAGTIRPSDNGLVQPLGILPNTHWRSTLHQASSEVTRCDALKFTQLRVPCAETSQSQHVRLHQRPSQTSAQGRVG